ncbi:MAG: hypothetical protein AAFZ38_04110 [Myxococcota bacterium]
MSLSHPTMRLFAAVPILISLSRAGCSDENVTLFRDIESTPSVATSSIEPPSDLDESVATRLSFGDAVALDAETLMVGATGADGPAEEFSGATFVYTAEGETFRLTQTLNGGEGVVCFGESIALDGDRALIGDDEAQRVIEFGLSDGAWTRRGTVDVPLLGFGNRLDFDGATLVVRAEEAAVFFARTGDTWAEIGRDEQSWGRIAVDGDTVLLGGADIPAASVFRVSNADVVLESALEPPGSLGGLGESVALQGDLAVIGQVQESRTEPPDNGRVLIYRRVDSTGWTLLQTLEVDVFSTRFGLRVALNQDLLAVTAPLDDDAAPDAGALYLFEREGDNRWVLREKFVSPTPRADEQMGSSAVVLDSDRVIWSSETADVDGIRERGRVEVIPLAR